MADAINTDRIEDLSKQAKCYKYHYSSREKACKICLIAEVCKKKTEENKLKEKQKEKLGNVEIIIDDNLNHKFFDLLKKEFGACDEKKTDKLHAILFKKNGLMICINKETNSFTVKKDGKDFILDVIETEEDVKNHLETVKNA